MTVTNSPVSLMRLRGLWLGVALGITSVPTLSVAQLTYCRSDLKIVEQAPEWCRQRGRPWVTVVVPSKPTEVESRKLIQLQLRTLGFDPGPSDGLLGLATINAIRQFQRSVGLDPDGAITSALQTQLDQRTRPKPGATEVPNARAATPPMPQPPLDEDAGTPPLPGSVIKSQFSNYHEPKAIVLAAMVSVLLAVALGGLAGVAWLAVKVITASKNGHFAVHGPEVRWRVSGRSEESF